MCVMKMKKLTTFVACATGWCVMLMVEVPFYFWQKARNE